MAKHNRAFQEHITPCYPGATRPTPIVLVIGRGVERDSAAIILRRAQSGRSRPRCKKERER